LAFVLHDTPAFLLENCLDFTVTKIGLVHIHPVGVTNDEKSNKQLKMEFSKKLN